MSDAGSANPSRRVSIGRVELPRFLTSRPFPDPRSPTSTMSTRAQSSSLRQRLVTGILGSALAVAGIVALPSSLVFVVVFVIFTWAAVEFIGLGRALAPTAPLGSLWLFVPLAQIGGFLALRSTEPVAPQVWVGGLFALVAAVSLTCLFSGAQIRDKAVGMGLMAFAIPYFALGSLACYLAHRIDRWWLLILVAIVVLGDTFAYFTGRRFGKNLLAPTISPKKTWEGSIGGFLGAVAATAVGTWLLFDQVHLGVLAAAAAASIMAQTGDLVESALKRAAGVKDSSNILPGHGGFYDRLDAMILGGPTFVVGLWLAGFGA